MRGIQVVSLMSAADGSLQVLLETLFDEHLAAMARQEELLVKIRALLERMR